MSNGRRTHPSLVPLKIAVALVLAASIFSCTGGGDDDKAAKTTEPSRSEVAKVPAGASSKPVFVDVTAASGIDFRHTTGAKGERQLAETTVGGLGWLDYDGDGRLDLYVTNGNEHSGRGGVGTVSNRLYRNLGGGKFEDVTEKAGVGDQRYGSGVAIADFDNDGDDDLYVANFGRNTLYRNEGDGTFRDITEESGTGDESWSSSAIFVDVDLDGLLDLWVANYVVYDPTKKCRTRGLATYCSPGEFSGAPDRLYRNRGGGKFEDVGSARGVAIGGPDAGKSLGVVAFDYDDDGDQDVYVACDQVPNLFFENDGGGSFREIGLVADVAYSREGASQAGMGVDVGDLDLDGLPDLVVTNFSDERNAHYRNEGNGFFRDVSASSGFGGPSLPLLGFGVVLIDYDLDSDLDAYVANGHVLDNADKMRDGQTFAQSDLLLSNDGFGRFRDVSSSSGPWFAEKRVSRGAASADFDDDGDEDLAILTSGGSLTLLRNESEKLESGRGHWIALALRGKEGTRDALGAKVRVSFERGGKPLRRFFEVRRGSSYASSCDPRVRVGLGRGDIDKLVVEIRWPRGTESRHEGLEIDRVHEIAEGGVLARGQFFVGAARGPVEGSTTQSSTGTGASAKTSTGPSAGGKVDWAKLLAETSSLMTRHRVLDALALVERTVPPPAADADWTHDELALRDQQAQLLRLASRPEEAQALLEVVYRKGPGRPGIIRRWSRALLDAGKPGSAIEILEKQSGPILRDALETYGRALIADGNIRGGAAAFATQLILDPWNDPAYLNLGRALARLGLDRWAAVMLERYRGAESWRQAEQSVLALEYAGDDAKAKRRRSEAELDRGRLFRAMKLAQEALQMNPGLVAAYYDLARISTFLGQPDDAKRALESLRAKSGDHPSLFAALGRVYEALGQVDAAKTAYRTALDGDAKLLDIAVRLGRLESGEPPQVLEDPEPETLRALRFEVQSRIGTLPVSKSVPELVKLVPVQIQNHRGEDARALALFLFRVAPKVPGVGEAVLGSHSRNTDLFVRLWVLHSLGVPMASELFDGEFQRLGLDRAGVQKILMRN